MKKLILFHQLWMNLKKQGLNIIGPLPADTLFTNKHLKAADAVLAMYHDPRFTRA